MKVYFDREEALKRLRLTTFEKRAVATVTSTRSGENPDQARRQAQVVAGGAAGGNRSPGFMGAGIANTNAISSVNSLVTKNPAQAKTGSKVSSKFGVGTPPASSGGSLSTGLVSKAAKTNMTKALKGTTSGQIKTSNAQLNKEAQVANLIKGLRAAPGRIFKRFRPKAQSSPEPQKLKSVVYGEDLKPKPVFKPAGTQPAAPQAGLPTDQRTRNALEAGLERRAAEQASNQGSRGPGRISRGFGKTRDFAKKVMAYSDPKEKVPGFRGMAARGARRGAEWFTRGTAVGTGASAMFSPMQRTYRRGKDGNILYDAQGRPKMKDTATPKTMGQHLKTGLGLGATLAPLALAGPLGRPAGFIGAMQSKGKFLDQGSPFSVGGVAPLDDLMYPFRGYQDSVSSAVSSKGAPSAVPRRPISDYTQAGQAALKRRRKGQ